MQLGHNAIGILSVDGVTIALRKYSVKIWIIVQWKLKKMQTFK